MFVTINFSKHRLRWIAGVLLVLIVTGWYFWPQSAPTVKNTEHSSSHCGDVERLLCPAAPPMQGEDVEELQSRLKTLGYYTGPIDGLYVGKTVEAVKTLQKQKGLSPDGTVTAETWLSMDSPVTTTAEPSKSPTPVEEPKGTIMLVVDTEKNTLTVLADGKPYKNYPVCTGKTKTPSPIGDWTIIDKQKNWGDGFGSRWMGFNVPWGIYGIHGTNKPWSIGKNESAGCIRMHNRDVEELYTYIPLKTVVRVIDAKPFKLSKKKYILGETGQEIARIQMRLQEKGYPLHLADGRFGPEMEEAVRSLQKKHQLPVDGIVNEAVMAILDLMVDDTKINT
ncbi:L,D-transpeptidase family protein [Heliobacillus mobilis]|uniref:L,D-transpeptidase family protein n=1 Tax=Heliobacterium mobile TaxID=28064 RepID=A0A6I3SNX1_HELMO|nr:peptidoglycan-binding protein [Heliobacterium mobile]MTV50734.1 L,D-transpeptidase family protein [Heliobacterium mobile]